MLRSLLRLLSLALSFFLASGNFKGFRPGNVAGWILWNHPSAIWDPPFCATRVLAVVMDIVDAAQQVIAMTADCAGEMEDPANCANDIFGFLTDMVDIADTSAAMAMACGGEMTSCEQAAMDNCEDGFTIASDLIGASGNCDVDAFICTINVADTVKHMISWALDVRAAVSVCPKAHPNAHLLRSWMHAEHPEWYKYRLLNHGASGSGGGSKSNASPEASSQFSDEYFEPTVSSMYRAVMSGNKLIPYHKSKTRLGMMDVTHSGPILAVDAPGVIRMGSAYVLPSTNVVFQTDKTPADRDERRLSVHEDVEPSQLATLHDSDIEVFFFGELEQPEDGPWGIEAFE